MRVLARGPLRLASHFWNERWLSPEGRPARRPSTLKSSSKSGQWIPSPCPIQRQFLRSFAVACSSEDTKRAEPYRSPVGQVDGQRIARRGDPDSAWRLAFNP